MADTNDRSAYLARIASLYYQGKTEQEIADTLNIQAAEIAGLLAEARKTGVVEVTIHHPQRTSPELEESLTAAFNLKAVRVWVRENKPYPEMVQTLGELAAEYFAGILQEDSIIGISWGSALYQMIKALRPVSLPNAEVVQLIGATGSENVPTDGPILAQFLTERLGCNCHYLHVPLVVEDKAGRDALLKNRAIRQTLARAEEADIALVGIGSTNPALYSLTRAGYVSDDELKYLRSVGAVGDICAQHYSATGKWLNIGINHRVMGITLNALSRIDTVIGVAGGARKAETILAALKGGYVNVLITDDEAARAVLALRGAAPEDKTQKVVEVDAAEAPAVASLKGIWKIFDGVPVLRGVNLDVKPGEIHALMGGNGSGKSTLMKILSGVYTAESGEILLEGKPVQIEGPAHAHQLGIYLVPQEPNVFPHLSVEENILIGSSLEAATARERIKRLAEEFGFEENLSEPAGKLNIANQQLLEIIRGLLRNAKILILDEPTSTLTFREVDSLFARLRKLTERGIGIIFISHRLNEVLDISDRVSVLRDGVFVLDEPTANLTSRDLIRAMLPDAASAEVDEQARRNKRKPGQIGEIVLEVNSLSGEAFHNVSFNIRAGEVVGLAGLVGAGRTELAQAIFGIDKHVRGNVSVNGKPLLRRSPRICQDTGLIYVPEDRHEHGIFLELPNAQTTTAGILPHLGRFLLSFKQEKHIANQFVNQLKIKVTGLSQLSRTLSGGNQQKVVLSKALAGQPRVIILDEPTRGVDAKARQDVYQLIQQLTTDGVGILLISSDLEEVTQLSDRVLVMYHGAIAEELAHSDCQIERITEAAFGLRGAL